MVITMITKVFSNVSGMCKIARLRSVFFCLLIFMLSITALSAYNYDLRANIVIGLDIVTINQPNSYTVSVSNVGTLTANGYTVIHLYWNR